MLQVSVSEPTWNKVSFLNVRMSNGTTHYGCFGYTNHDVGIGYYFGYAFPIESWKIHCSYLRPQQKQPIELDNLAQLDQDTHSPSNWCASFDSEPFSSPNRLPLWHHLAAAGIAGIAFAFGLFGLFFHRFGTIVMALLAGLALLTCFVAWVIDMILFGIARQRYRDEGLWAQYGNANWLTLGALTALIGAFAASVFSAFGRYRRRRSVAASTMPTYSSTMPAPITTTA